MRPTVPRSILHRFPSLLLLLFILLCALPASAHADNTGLVGYWKFDEGTSTQAGDSSGNGRTGTTSAPWVSGKHGTALDFSNYNSAPHVDLGTNLSIVQNVQQVTIAVWVKKTAQHTGDVNDIVELSVNNGGTPTGNSRALLEFTSGDLIDCGGRAPDSQGKQNVVSVNAISWNVWHHIACTINYSNNTILQYVDGVLQSTTGSPVFTQTSTDNTVSTDAAIGSDDNGGSGTSYFGGSLDDVRIYNRALSATEVAKLYTAGATLHKPPNNLGLVAYWSFNDGTGTTATDFSGNGYTGTLTATISTLPTWVSGKHGKALSFTSSNNSYVTTNLATSNFRFGCNSLCMD